MKNKISLVAVGAIFALSGCTASSVIQSNESGVNLTVNDQGSMLIEEPVSKTYSTTSFGQYKFKAAKEGKEPMYGLIPLKFNGGYLAADILFFAPAMFFNLREVYPFYEFDLDAGVVKYKKNEEDEWLTYTPTEAEVQHAKDYFMKQTAAQ
ncbi:hypothetical protein [uncultured Photobacterium sp.]|uniref:hypothetical protein n=1 Tax=uncultured Photobacterium sp. TaxID=173973 RepID=UPI00262E72BE|nr:hypothetical protein [uncultured Photobacterium sp.]